MTSGFEEFRRLATQKCRKKLLFEVMEKRTPLYLLSSTKIFFKAKPHFKIVIEDNVWIITC